MNIPFKIDPTKIPAVMDGEGERDLNSIRVCSKCGGMNLSIDLSTNKTVCNDCNEKNDENKMLDFQKYTEKLVDQDMQVIYKSIRKGDKYTM
jgi:acetyl-CoA carboxylase beta subunit